MSEMGSGMRLKGPLPVYRALISPFVAHLNLIAVGEGVGADPVRCGSEILILVDGNDGGWRSGVIWPDRCLGLKTIQITVAGSYRDYKPFYYMMERSLESVSECSSQYARGSCASLYVRLIGRDQDAPREGWRTKNRRASCDWREYVVWREARYNAGRIGQVEKELKEKVQ